MLCDSHPGAKRCSYTTCSEDGFFTQIFVIDDSLEREANWGRGSSVTGVEGVELPPDTVVISQNIADALRVKNGDEVILQLRLE